MFVNLLIRPRLLAPLAVAVILLVLTECIQDGNAARVLGFDGRRFRRGGVERACTTDCASIPTKTTFNAVHRIDFTQGETW